MFVPEIIEVKEFLSELQRKGLIVSWELPYENILTRRSAALFFLTPANGIQEEQIWAALGQFDHFSYRLNTEKMLSQLLYRITFSKEEKEKNLEQLTSA